jgi:hypothetical protein
MIAKPISIKGTGGKSGGRAWKAVELITGDLPWLSWVTSGVVRHREGRAEVSRGRSSRASDEGLNDRKGQ